MDENYFQNIPKWNDSPRFSIMADKFNGRIPVTRVDSWREFNSLLEDEFFNKPNLQYAFRGHRRCEWGLLPSLGG